MATVTVEMSPQGFDLVNVQNGTFVVGDLVTISGAKGSLPGHVTALKDRTYGQFGDPGVAVMVAVTGGRLSDFSAGGLAGYEVKQLNGNTVGTVRTPCHAKYRGQLMKSTELQKMHDSAEALIKEAATIQKSDYALQWFGKAAFDDRVLATIRRRCGDLNAGVSGLARVLFQCGQSETLGAIDTNDSWRGGGNCRIKLGRGFTYDRYSWGERVCTVVHELTHWFLDTVDATLAGGGDCYGGDCLKLARSQQKSEREKALNNADNWAYYICQYRSSGDTGDWSNFTEKEIADRGPFVSGGYNVVPGLIDAFA